MSNKETVLSYIQDRTGNITNDCNTYLWARTTHFREFNQKAFGGGNLLIALGLFASLSYLGKIYHLLRGKPVFLENDSAMSAYNSLPSNLKRYFLVRQNGQLDETQAFKELIVDAFNVQMLGLHEQEIISTYKDIRHKLTHMVAPRSGNTMLANVSEDKNYETVVSIMESDGTVVFQNKDGVRWCDVDRLNRDVKSISNWLASEVKSGRFDQNIDYTLEWIEAALG